MDPLQVFKVYHLTNLNTINSVIVFYGIGAEKMEDLFMDEPTNREFLKIFKEDELKYIIEQSIPVYFSDLTIHEDDNVGTVKLKVSIELKKISQPEDDEQKFSKDGLYLYCLKKERINPVLLYQILTQNDNLRLTKVRLNQFLLNVKDENGNQIEFHMENKEKYTYDDLLKLNLQNSNYYIAKPLGQKFFMITDTYPFVANPYQIEEYDPLLEKSRDELSTLNGNLLLTTGKIYNNTIYACTAYSVFKYDEDNNINSEYTSKIYFPFLHKDGINSFNTFIDAEDDLLKNDEKMVTRDLLNNFKSVDMFYDVYKDREDSDVFKLIREKTGIKNINITLYPEFNMKLPIEIIFKLLHANLHQPLIKYNPSSKHEKIYRLYTNKLSIDGKKIPYLDKATIFRLMRNIGKTQSVAVYIEISKSDTIICEFFDDGSIEIYPEGNFKQILRFDDREKYINIDNLLKKTVNPLIDDLRSFFEQSGYKLPHFKSILDVNVEINNILFETVYKISQKIDLKPLEGCISSVFNIENQDKSNYILRYKRVSNFNKHVSQEAFIIEKFRQGKSADEILNSLLDSYKELTEEQASEMIRSIISELEVQRGIKRKKMQIKDNPGFKTTLTVNAFNAELIIDIDGIDYVSYLDTIPIYIDTLIRITQDPESTSYSIDEINDLCSGNIIKDTIFEEIVAASEKPIGENTIASITENEEIFYDEERAKETQKNILELYGDFGEEFEGYEGGAINTDSDEPEVSTPDISLKESSQDSSLGSLGSLGSFKSNSSEPDISDLNKLEEEVENIEVPGSSDKDDISGLSGLEDISDLEKDKSFELKNSLEEDLEEEEQKEEDRSLFTLKPDVLQEEIEVPSIGEDIPSIGEEIPSIEEEIPSIEEEIPSIEEEIEVPSVKEDVDLDVDFDIDTKTISDNLSKLSEFEVSSEPKKEEIIEKKIPVETKKKIETIKKKLENTVRSIVGLRLKSPYIWQKRIEERDPGLLKELNASSEKDGYARMCPSQSSRQPVILSSSERQKIIDDHPELYNDPKKVDSDFIEYRNDPENPSEKLYYMCPRYWCLLTDTMVTKAQIMAGECGGKPLTSEKEFESVIIPKSEKTVPEGKYVYKFYDDDSENFPGFHKEETPDGNCIPCCFSNWNTGVRKTRRDKCKSQGTDVPISVPEKKEAADQYIKGSDKYPLPNRRWGFLPITIQKILHISNADCQVSKTNTNIKLNHPCLLRHGVENSSKQSFIACIANAMFYADKDPETGANRILSYISDAKDDVPSIKEMKEIIISAIDLDSFITYQNGNLPSIFYDESIDVNIDDYAETKLYDKMLGVSNRRPKKIYSDESPIEQEIFDEEMFFTRVVKAYENFKNYLRDDTIILDHTYLWDIISRPNPMLFNSGINIVIFQTKEGDTENNTVEIICPSNHFSNQAYVSRRRTLILIKRGNYFEPIYTYEDTGKRINVIKTYTEYHPKLSNISKSMRQVLEKIIKPVMQSKCLPLPSLPKKYKYNIAPPLPDLIDILNSKNYEIKMQILNFDAKVIGLLVQSSSGLNGFIPCYPSSLCVPKYPRKEKECEYDYMYMNQEIWSDYSSTLDFLKEYYNYSEPSSNNYEEGRDLAKIVEHNNVVGFLTNTNQYIPIQPSEPVEDVIDNIHIIHTNDIFDADETVEISSKENVDKKRVDYINRIELETNFYNVFRNTIKILLNDYTNSDKRKKIQQECNKTFMIYTEKLEEITELLRDLVGTNIVFSDSVDIKDIKDVYTCITKSVDKCEKPGSVCIMTDDKCTLVLPKYNLITKANNEEQYFGKMADELLRYNRIKSIIFKPQSFLSFGTVNYKINEDEIIILQSLITQDYFRELIPSEDINSYVKYNTIDNVNPSLTQTYSTQYNLDSIINPQEKRDCMPNGPVDISSAFWKKCFPETYKELQYASNNHCTFYVVIDIVKQVLNQKFSIMEIRHILNNEYYKLTNEYKSKHIIDKIADILTEEGKKFFGDQLKNDILTISEMIYTDSYFLTNFDLWLCMSYFKIQSILVSVKNITESRFNEHQFVLYTSNDKLHDKYVFIIAPGLRENYVPPYKIIINNDGLFSISLDDIKEGLCIENVEKAVKHYVNVEEYLVLYKREKKTKYLEKQPGIRKDPIKVLMDEYDVIEEEETEAEGPTVLRHDYEFEEESAPIPRRPKPIKRKVVKLEDYIILEDESEEEKAEEHVKHRKVHQKDKKIVVNAQENPRKKVNIEEYSFDEESD